MHITWLGQSTFIIKGEHTLVTDPYGSMLGDLPKNLSADVVTVSHGHADHNNVAAVGGNPLVIDHLGQVTSEGYAIHGTPTFHDDEGGQKRGNNIVFTIETEGIRICHLGDLGHVLTKEQLAEIGSVDILMIPVGGFYTIDAEHAVEVVNQINPKIVLPMHYKPAQSAHSLPLSGVEPFTQALDWPLEEASQLTITNQELESVTPRIIVLSKES